MTTLIQIKQGAGMPAPVYVSDPYILLNKHNVVMESGTLEHLKKLPGYFDHNTVEVRTHDLHLHDNTRIGAETIVDLENSTWTVKTYSSPFALCQVDIMRPLRAGDEIRWTYTLMIEIYPSAKGVDNNGTRACGNARPAIIDGTAKPQFKLIEIGNIVSTPFGNYRIEWASRTDQDNLKVTQVS